ncbi:hypothetical protein [Streptomyces sp. NBC_01601]|uniref:hypothetical protein n=1 Tax=Streptomyces sp. NBC_01601 TaxID=2975892 RepID=UPI002E2BEB68|nr:hypothetical protein [Streptomyces sp. NBC_01601]
MPAHPEVRIAAFEARADLMNRNGWAITRHAGRGEARLEGVRRGGAAVMVTARYSETKGWRIRHYVIGSVSDGWIEWARVRRSAQESFIATDRLDGTPVRWLGNDSKCRCRKTVSEPTEWRALQRLAEVKLARLATRGVEAEKRVYRCPDDARRWHMTSQERRGPETWSGAHVSL